MKIVYIVLLLFIGLWIFLAAYLVNYIHISSFLPQGVTNLTLPKSTEELGGSLSILDGLFSSIAIVIGLVTILYQSKELRETTRALSVQIEQQNRANRLSAYTARLQFLLGETDRLTNDINRLLHELESTTDKQKSSILTNTIEKRRKYRYEAEKINKILATQLEEIT